MTRQITKILVLCFILMSTLFAKQTKDIAIYETKKNFANKDQDYLTTDFSNYKHVRDLAAYNPVFHTPPIRQDTTNTCWCFATTSFLESELHRLGKGDIKLSRMYTVYWEYIQKIERFVDRKSDSYVAEGSEPNAVINVMKKYGAVRAEDYTGLLDEATVYNHRKMHNEIMTYLDYVKENELWYKDQVLENIKMILNRYMGTPPEKISVNGNLVTPLQFVNDILQLPLDDYVSFISMKKHPFWTQASFDVPDNWWKAEDYYNLPLDDFYSGIKSAIQNGYSVTIMGDVSEPGKWGWQDIGIIPSFDIPATHINQDAREFRFYNKTTQDDHSMHLIGYHRYKGDDWFLIKDSSASAWKGDFDGYHFFHQDYIKIKILAFMAHKDAVEHLLENF